MIFDSEEQKKRVIELVGEAPVATNIAGIMQGPSPQLKELMYHLRSAHVLSVDDQTSAIMHVEEVKHGSVPSD